MLPIASNLACWPINGRAGLLHIRGIHVQAPRLVLSRQVVAVSGVNRKPLRAILLINIANRLGIRNCLEPHAAEVTRQLDCQHGRDFSVTATAEQLSRDLVAGAGTASDRPVFGGLLARPANAA